MENKNSGNDAILQTNGLRYVMPRPLSTSLNRTFKKQYSQRQSYGPNDTIVFDLNISGQVDPEVSYLTFAMSSDQGYKFEKGSVLNIIRDIRIQSKNGVELDRIQNLNAWNYIRLNYNEDETKLEKDKVILGRNTSYGATPFQFCIPLSHLSGLFRPMVKGQKIPSHLLSGARIELQLESVARALTRDTTTDNTTYTITSPTLVMMEHQLNDNTTKVLSEVSANNGLEYVYPRVFCSVETTSNNVLNTQIKKAVSQATCVITSVHPASAQSNVQADSFASIAPAGGAFNKFQYRIASNYYPQVAVDNISEAYKVSDSCTREKHIIAPNSFNSYVGNTFAVAVPLKSDHEISSSGLAINNSATLALEYESSDAVNKVFYTFLEYTALARVFLQQTTVKI